MTDLATIGFKADVTGLKQGERALDSLARKGETSEKRINKSVDNVNQSFMSLKSTIGLAGAALTALGSAQLSREIIKQSDAWKNINSQIRQVTKSEEELISVRDKLVKLSKDTRSELTNTVDLYAQLNRSTKDLGVSEGELLNITKTLNNLFVAGGKPISEVSGAIRQLSQGFAAGALRGDEFNSVAEGAPKIMDALAAKLKMTRGELREFAATGGITASIMVEALRDYEQVAQRLADQTTQTFGQAMENATTNITKFVGEADGINSVVDSLGSGIEDLSNNLNALVDGMQAAATVVGVAAIPVLGKYTISLGQAAVAQLTMGTTATKTINALGMVTTTAASATVATNALTAATRLLMGPWGLLITAVGAGAIAFANSRDKIDDVNESIKDTNKELENSISILQRLQNQTDKTRNADIGTFGQDRLREEIGKSVRLIELYTERLEKLKSVDASFARQNDLEEKLRAEKARLEEMNKAIGGAKTGYDLLTKSAQNLIESLDPVTKKQKELERGTKLLDTALKSGAISTDRYNKLLIMLKNSLTETIEQPFAEMMTALQLQRLELQMGADAFEIYQLRMEAIARGIAPELIEVLVREAKTLQELKKVTGDAGDELEDFADSGNLAADRLDQAFESVWSNMFNGFESMKDSLVNSFKQMIAQLIHQATTKKILLSLGIGGAGGLSAAGGLLGGLGGFGSGFGGTMSLLGAGSLSGAFSNIGALFGGGEIFAGIGALTPIVAGIGAIAGIADKLTGGGLFGTSYKPTGQSLSLGLSGGDVSGFATLTEKKKRSLFRGSKKRTTNTSFDTSAIDGIFDDVRSAIIDAAEMLDITSVTKTTSLKISKFFEDERILDALTSTVTMPVEEWLNKFSSSLKIDTKGMSEQEIQAEINAWAERTTEQMIGGVFGTFLNDVKKEGESSANALNRVIANMSVFDEVATKLNLNFGLVGKEAAIASTNIVELAGGLDNLAALSSQYYQSFFSEQDQLAQLTNNLTTSLDELGLAIPSSRDAFKSLVESLDLTTEYGQETFAALMQLVPGLDAYYNAIKNDQTNAINEAMAALQQSVALEKERATVILQAARDAFSAEMSRIEAARASALQDRDLAQNLVSTTENALKSAFDAEKNRITEASNERINALNAEISLINGNKSSLNSVINSMTSLASRLTSAAGLGSNASISDALNAARRGNFGLAESLSGELPSASGFTSSAEFRVAQAVAKNQLKSIADLASGRASSAQRQLAALNGMQAMLANQIETEKASATEQIAALENQLAGILGIDTSVLSIDEAIKQYQDAQLALDSLNTDELLNELSKQEEAAIALLDIAEQNYTDEIARLDSILENAQAQIDLLNGIQENTLTTAQAIENLNAAISTAQPNSNIALDTPTVGTPDFNDKNQDRLHLERNMNKQLVKMADTLQRIELGGLDTRQIS